MAKYRHFKGGIYEIITIAKLESDNNTDLVIYKSVENSLVWAREWSNFWGTVEVDGKAVPRFEEINEI